MFNNKLVDSILTFPCYEVKEYLLSSGLVAPHCQATAAATTAAADQHDNHEHPDGQPQDTTISLASEVVVVRIKPKSVVAVTLSNNCKRLSSSEPSDIPGIPVRHDRDPEVLTPKSGVHPAAVPVSSTEKPISSGHPRPSLEAKVIIADPAPGREGKLSKSFCRLISTVNGKSSYSSFGSLLSITSFLALRLRIAASSATSAV